MEGTAGCSATPERQRREEPAPGVDCLNYDHLAIPATAWGRAASLMRKP